MNTSELKNRLKNESFMFFGSGFVAELFYAALERNGLSANLSGVVETEPVLGRTFHSLEVKKYEDTDTKGEMLLVCVHDSVRDELNLKDTDETVFIYPYLWDLLFEGKVRREGRMKLSDILKSQDRNENWITVRYAGVKALMEDSEELKELYLRCLSRHCSPGTAKKRLQYLGKLIESVRREGFREDSPVLLDEDHKVIDGLHRIALATYLGEETIPARVYERSDVFNETLGERNRLTRDYLNRSGLREEAAVLRKLGEEVF